MKRSSPYFNLKTRVDCQPPGQAFYETIAAFNSDRVALAYAEDCRKSKQFSTAGQWRYRVMERRSRGWVEITKAAD